jgi:3-(3-hydroxy-phenyl)propionate hydroxylase
MRPKGRGDLESLYFRYPHFDPRPRDPAQTVETTPSVVICGAGPIGLVAALTLARFGVASIVLDRKSTFNDGSRAICIARSSMHVLAHIGAVQPFLDKALGWTTGRTFHRGRQILEFDMPHSDHERFLPMYNLQQQYIEQYLYDAAARSPLIDLRWQSEAVGVMQAGTSVSLQVRDPAGTYTIEAPWLLAADGARSAIRSMRGKRLKGENYEGRYVIADVKMVHDYPTIRRALFDPACRPGGTVLIHKQPDDIWRIDYQLGDSESADEATRESNVRKSVAAVLADIGHTGPWDLEWWSIYSANTLALDDYRDGRIVFIGDSAHIVPIFGVRGLNNGIADAHNIGWKLAYVLNGHASETLIDSYTPERRGATLDVFSNATKSARFMTPPTRGWQTVRDAALSLSLSHDFAGRFANPRQMTPYTYAASPLTIASQSARGPDDSSNALPGQFAPNLRLGDGTYLLDHLGAGFTLVLFGSTTAGDAATLNRAGRMIDPQFHVCEIADGTDTYAPAGIAAVLIRPDLYIAARQRAFTPGELAATLTALLSPAARS